MAGPGKRYKDLESGKVKSYEQLVKLGATDVDIKEMLDNDFIKETTEPVTGEVAVAEKKKSVGTPPSSGSSSTDTSPSASSTETEISPQQQEWMSDNTFENRTKLPEGLPNAPTAGTQAASPQDTPAPTPQAPAAPATTPIGKDFTDFSGDKKNVVELPERVAKKVGVQPRFQLSAAPLGGIPSGDNKAAEEKLKEVDLRLHRGELTDEDAALLYASATGRYDRAKAADLKREMNYFAQHPEAVAVEDARERLSADIDANEQIPFSDYPVRGALPVQPGSPADPAGKRAAILDGSPDAFGKYAQRRITELTTRLNDAQNRMNVRPNNAASAAIYNQATADYDKAKKELTEVKGAIDVMAATKFAVEGDPHRTADNYNKYLQPAKYTEQQRFVKEGLKVPERDRFNNERIGRELLMRKNRLEAEGLQDYLRQTASDVETQAKDIDTQINLMSNRVDYKGPDLANFVTKLPEDQEAKYQAWKQKLPENLQNEEAYDLRGLFKNDPQIQPSENLHFPDTYKLPNHPTFSDESIYFNDQTKDYAGKWKQVGENWIYTPYNPDIKQKIIEGKDGTVQAVEALAAKRQDVITRYEADPKLARYKQLEDQFKRAAIDYATLSDKYPEQRRREITRAIGEKIYADASPIEKLLHVEMTDARIKKAADELGIDYNQVKDISDREFSGGGLFDAFYSGMIRRPAAQLESFVSRNVRSGKAIMQYLTGNEEGAQRTQDITDIQNAERVQKAEDESKIADEAKMFGSPSKINFDAHDLSYLREVRNMEYGKDDNINWYSSLATVGDVAGQAMNYAVLSKGIGGSIRGAGAAADVAINANRANNIGTFASGFIISYEDNYQAAREFLPDAKSRTLFATIQAAKTAATELILPDYKLLDRMTGKAAVKASLKEYAKTVADSGVKGLTQSQVKNFVKRTLAPVLANVTKTSVEETTEEELDLVGDFVVNSMFGKDQSDRNMVQEARQTAVVTALGTLPMGLIGGGGNASRMRKDAFYEAGLNPDWYKTVINSRVDEGKMKRMEADRAIETVNAMDEIIRQLPKVAPKTGRKLTEQEKVDLAYNRLREFKIKQQKKDTTDEVLADQLDGAVKDVQAERKEILEYEPPKRKNAVNASTMAGPEGEDMNTYDYEDKKTSKFLGLGKKTTHRFDLYMQDAQPGDMMYVNTDTDGKADLAVYMGNDKFHLQNADQDVPAAEVKSRLRNFPGEDDAFYIFSPKIAPQQDDTTTGEGGTEQPDTTGQTAGGTDGANVERSIITALRDDAELAKSNNPLVSAMRAAIGTENEGEIITTMRQQFGNRDQFAETFGPTITGLMDSLGAEQVGRTSEEMKTDLNTAPVDEKRNKKMRNQAEQRAENDRKAVQGDIDAGMSKADIVKKYSASNFTGDVDARYNEILQNVGIDSSSKTNKDAIQEQSAAEVPVRDQSESSQEVPAGDTKGQETAGESQEKTLKPVTTRFGRPLDNFKRGVLENFEDYHAKDTGIRGMDESVKYEEQLMDVIRDYAKDKGVDLSNDDDMRKVMSAVMEGVYDEAGVQENEGKTMQDVVDKAIKKISSRKSKTNETSERRGMLRRRQEPVKENSDSKAEQTKEPAPAKEQEPAPSSPAEKPPVAPEKPATKRRKNLPLNTREQVHDHPYWNDLSDEDKDLVDEFLDAKEKIKPSDYKGNSLLTFQANNSNNGGMLAVRELLHNNNLALQRLTLNNAINYINSIVGDEQTNEEATQTAEKPAEKPAETPAEKPVEPTKPVKKEYEQPPIRTRADAEASPAFANLSEEEKTLVRNAMDAYEDHDMTKYKDGRREVREALWRASSQAWVNTESLLSGRYPNGQKINRKDVLDQIRQSVDAYYEYRAVFESERQAPPAAETPAAETPAAETTTPAPAEQTTAPELTEKEKLQQELKANLAKFQKALKGGGYATSGGINPEVIETGAAVIATYAKLGIHTIKEIVQNMMDVFGRDFFREPDNVEAVKGVYAYYRQNNRDDRKKMSTDDQVDDFIEQELPAMTVEPAEQNQTNNANDQSLPITNGNDQVGLDGGIPTADAQGAVADQQTEGLPGATGGKGKRKVRASSGTGTRTAGSNGSSQSGNAGTDTAGRSTGTESAAQSQGTTGDQGVPASRLALAPEERNHRIAEKDVIVPEGSPAKATANMDAILLLRTLEAENRNATPDEKKVLAKFVGWGGLRSYLDRDSDQVGKIFGYMLTGGRIEFGYGRGNVDFDALDTTGKSFDQIVKALQSKYAEVMSANPFLQRYVPSNMQRTVGLDEARVYAISNLLTDAEYQSAIASTENAHYTERTAIENMWALAQHLGFTGGHVLESSAGIGHFLGLMPQAIADNSRTTAVEKDSLSGRLLAKLYPEANVLVKGFEETRIPNNSVDLAIGNVPFASKGRVSDPNNKDIETFSLHNYFIARNLKLLKPGGVAILITTKATMDNPSSAKARRWFSAVDGGNSDFIGSVRLPNNAFDKNAGTQVTTDVMVFQKRKGTAAVNHENIASIVNKRSEEIGGELAEININEYYDRHPDRMLGEMKFAFEVGSGGLYGKLDATLHAPKSLNVMKAMREKLLELPAGLFNAEQQQAREEVKTTQKSGFMYMSDDGKILVSEGDVAVEPDFKYPAHHEVAKQYIPVRDQVRKLVLMEQDKDATDEVLQAERDNLNKLYDEFVDKHGTITKNSFLYEYDIDYSLAASVEDVEEKVVVQGKSSRKQFIVSKADIFSKRVNFPYSEPRTATDLADAIKISMAYRNAINEDYIGSMLGMTGEEARAALLENELVFENPGNGLLESPDEYLSGQVRDKLEEAEQAAEEDTRFARNVDELKKVIPEDMPASQIRFKMGVSYLPKEIYTAYIKDRLGVSVDMTFMPGSGKWAFGQAMNVYDSRNTSTYAVGDKTGLEIIGDIMNNRTTLVYVDGRNDEGKKVRVMDEALTQAAVDMQDRITQEFSNFVKGDEQHKAVLERTYNRAMRGWVERKQSLPSFDRFPGASDKVMLRDHQKRAVLRNLHDNTLLAHGVGTGKTYILISTAMEMRRLGLAKKPMITVYNSTLKQFATSFMKAYPSAKILVPGDKDMGHEGRRRFLSRAATGDWDAVIIPQSFINRIPDNPARVEAFLTERIQEIQETIDNLDDDTPFYIRQQMEREVTALENEVDNLYKEFEAEQQKEDDLERKLAGEPEKKKKKVKDLAADLNKVRARVMRQAARRTDNILYFDDLNVDALLVDEAHEYKKLGLSTGMQKVRGIDKKTSKQALSIYLKIQSVRDRTGGKNIVFATGTPITNTMAELWTMMRFMRPQMVEDMGIKYFDQFVQNFVIVEPSAEPNAGGRIDVVNRLSRFANQPDLIAAFRTFADVVTTDDIPEFKADPDNAPPQVKDGKITQVQLEPSKPLKKMLRHVLATYDAWKELRGKEKKEKSFYPLLLALISKVSAVDQRMIDPDAVDDPDSKVNRVVEQIIARYKEFDQFKATQMVFADQANGIDTPIVQDLANVAPQKNNFNLYDDIRDKLVAAGIPRNEIAVMSDSKWGNKDRVKKLWDDMNEGIVRIAIGSSTKMGVGVNANLRMIALHHVDAPPRPDQFEQRNGRIIRQGSMYAKLGIPVEILTYGVKGSRDEGLFGILQRKAKFITQIMKGEIKDREINDPTAEEDGAKDLESFFDEMSANLSGSQYAVDLVIAKKDLKNEQYRKDTFAQRQIDNYTKLRNKEKGLEDVRDSIQAADAALEVKHRAFPSGTIDNVTIDGATIAEKMGEAIDQKATQIKGELLKNNSKTYQHFDIDVNGVPITMQIFRTAIDKFSMQYSSHHLNILNKVVESGTGNGFLQTVRKQMDTIEYAPTRWRNLEEQTLKDIETLKKELEETYDDTKYQDLRNKVALLEESKRQEAEERANEELREHATEEKLDELARLNAIDETDLPADSKKARNDRIKQLQQEVNDEIEKAKKDLRDEMGNQMSSGLPLNALPQLVRLAGLYIRKGIQTAAQFARQIGAKLNKVIVAAWNQAKDNWKQSQQMGVISPSMRRFMAAGANTGSGGNAGNTGNAANSPGAAPQAPPTGAAPVNPKSSLSQLAQKRADALKNGMDLLATLQEALFGAMDIQNDQVPIKPTILGRAGNLINVVQDVTFGAASRAASKGLKAAVTKALESKNKALQELGSVVNNVFSNLGKSTDDVLAGEKFSGETRSRWITDAIKISEKLRTFLDNNQASLDRIQRVLDPEFYTEMTEDDFRAALETEFGKEAIDKMPPSVFVARYDEYRAKMGFDDPNYVAPTYDTLTLEEKKVHDIIRSMYDMMHEINFGIGKLTESTYDENKGVYSARLYNSFEIPKEARDAMKFSPNKMDEGLYMEQGDVTEWKLLNRLSDPVYAVTKRMYQTMTNKAIMDYASYVVKSKPDAVSTSELPGYRKLGWGYGALSNKWVRNDVAEDFVGHFFADGVMQKMYDYLRAYDRLPIRQFFKKLYTVYNPGTHLGNLTGNYVFAWLTGISPMRLSANVPWALKQAEEYSPEYRYLLSNGVLQSDMTQTDHKNAIDEMNKLLASEEEWWGEKLTEKLKKIYRGTDDVYKMAAFKSLLEKGYTAKQAIDMVKDGFQNYHRVGKAYDVFSKVPLVGSPFGKFSGDLMRIFRKSITERPLQTAAFLASLRLMSLLFSYMSGEDERRRKIREGRVGVPKIPFPDALGGDVPLVFKVGSTEWNVARFMSPMFVYGSADQENGFEFFQRLSPMPIEVPEYTKNPNGWGGVFMAKNANDPVLAPLAQLVFNSDFRGVPVFDPKQDIFRESMLTKEEKGANALRFVLRQYMPYYSLADDNDAALAGDKDYYGRDRKWWQVMANFVGPKITEFPETRYGDLLKQRMDSYGYQYKREVAAVKAITKERSQNKITQEQFEKRVAPHTEQMQQIVIKAKKDYEDLKKSAGSIPLINFNPAASHAKSRKKQKETYGAPAVQVPVPDIQLPNIQQ